MTNLHQFAKWWADNRSCDQAQQWYDGFISTLDSLGAFPERGCLARENGRFPYELRELHYGLGHKPTHRAIYTVRPDMVFVVAIHHAAQDDLTAGDE